MVIDEKTLEEINEAWCKLAEIFQELKEKLLKAWNEAVEPLAEAVKEAVEMVKEHKSLLRRAPKWYSKANNPYIIANRIRIFHCKNNC